MPAPKFEVCTTCGKHGRIVGADGFYSCEVYSQSYARHMVEIGIQYDTLKSSDAFELFRQIRCSGLPLRDDEVDETTEDLVVTWNWARTQVPGDNTNPDEIHTVLEQSEQLVAELQALPPGFKIIDLRKRKPN